MRPCLIVVLLIASSLGGCVSHRAIAPGAATAASEVRVRFADPRALPAVTSRGDTATLDAASAVIGDVVAVRGDTIELRVSELRPSRPSRRGAVVRIVPAPGDRVDVREPSVLRTLGAVGGGLLLVLGIAAVVSCGAFCGV